MKMNKDYTMSLCYIGESLLKFSDPQMNRHVTKKLD